MGLEEAVMHGGAVEALASRRQEGRKKSTFCGPKDNLKAYLCTSSACVIALEYEQGKCTSTAWMTPNSKLLWRKLIRLYLLSREETMSVEQLLERMAQAGGQSDGNIRVYEGNIREKNMAQDICDTAMRRNSKEK